MSTKRRCEFVNINEEFISSTQNVGTEIDWDLCVLCQQDLPDVLVCPANSKRSDKGIGYKSLLDDLLAFDEIKGLPSIIKTKLLKNHDVVEQLLNENCGKFHKTCRNKFDKHKLARLSKKPKLVQDTFQESTSRCTRASFIVGELKDTCFFCDEESGAELINVRTLELSNRV